MKNQMMVSSKMNKERQNIETGKGLGPLHGNYRFTPNKWMK